mmetsp:Transcript_87187/g.182458  ORF Transcript_87187/g.182458 Transcript_87187/m.182458 type:complete len:519 (+) Transcript_87187:163-1719(+)
MSSSAPAPTVPDLSTVRPKLYLGSVAAARGTEMKRLTGFRISHVLSVGPEFPDALEMKVLRDDAERESRIVEGRSEEGRIYLREGSRKDPFVRLFLNVDDSTAENLIKHLDEVRMFISEGLAQGAILVHCTTGTSSSAAVVAAFLMMKEKASLGKVLVSMKEKRADIALSAPFVEQLRLLEGRLELPPSSPKTAALAGIVPKKNERQEVNPQVYLELNLDGQSAGRLEIELFADVVPQTAENFRALCTGERGRGSEGKRLNYLGSPFHKVVPGVICAGGDITLGNGTGGESIYGLMFEDENFEVKHDARGILSMANSGPNTNGSQFFICLAPLPHLDGRNVAFGRIVGGLDVLDKMEECGAIPPEDSKSDFSFEPTKKITVIDCGEAEQRGKALKRPKLADGSIVRVLHILKKHSGCKKPKTWKGDTATISQEEARTCLRTLKGKLDAVSAETRRKEFEDMARSESDCKSAKKGGDLGPFERGLMQKPFEDAAFKLQVGEMSDVVTSKLGEHLLFRIA